AQGTLAQQLLRDLFTNYSRALRPVGDTERALNVTLQVTLAQIIDMVSECHLLMMSPPWAVSPSWGLSPSWECPLHDECPHAGGPLHLHPHPWVLLPSADDRFGGSLETNVVLDSDGRLTWDSPAITKSSCRVDVSYFPFDGQRCPLTFGSWTYNGNQIDLRNQRDSGDLRDFVENVEWEVLGMPATRNVVTYGCCSEPYPDVTYTLVLRRRASFYVFNLLLPCIMVSFLAPLGFYLPADSGEKVSLGVTVLLALTVFQMLVAESMPPSESVPLIGKYYIATMTMITASTALTIFIMSLHHCGPGARPVPPWARTLILHHLARLCCVHETAESRRSPREVLGRKVGKGNTKMSEENPEEGGGTGGCPRGHCLCHHQGLVRNVEAIAAWFRRHRAAQRRTGEWKKVAKVMDRFFMWVFFFMVFLMSVLVLGKAA
ncbi:Neuronal acetylcholine receptor subunit alpha-10, partial [Calypte anna]